MAQDSRPWLRSNPKSYGWIVFVVLAGVFGTELHSTAALAPASTHGDLRPAYVLIGYAPADRFSNPRGVALDERNRILYVADTGKGRVVGFSLQGLPKFTLTIDGISAPYDLAVDDHGQLYISDKETPTLRVVDAQGKTVGSIDLSSAGTTAPPLIRGLAVDKQDRLYIGDQVSGQVLVCDATGHVFSRIGSRGERPGQLKMIEDIALDRVGRVYVVDSIGTAVNVFDPGGKFIFRFGTISTQPDGLLQPMGISLDRHDQIWVVDQNGHTVSVFDGRGFIQRRFGADIPGGFERFLFPVSVALDRMGHVYVVEQGSGQVQVFTLENPFLPFH